MVLSPNWVARAHVCSWTGLAQAQMTPSKRMLLLDLASQRQNGLFHCRVDGPNSEGRRVRGVDSQMQIRMIL